MTTLKDGTIIEPLCVLCAHTDGFDWGFCKAYPTGRGIPQEILEGKVDHTKPYKGDDGIVFKPA